MTTSFYNGVSGIKTQQFGIDVMGDNIANINTVGFRSSNPEFKDIFYGQLSTTSFKMGESDHGNGATAQTTALSMQQGSIINTDNQADMAIGGKGWFGVADGKGNKYYTRAGDFKLDADGNLVTAAGEKVLGAMSPAVTAEAGSKGSFNPSTTVPDTLLSSAGAVSGLKIPQYLTYTDPVTKQKSTLKAFSVDEQGRIVGQFENGKSGVIGQVALFHFRNEQALNKVGSSLFTESANSGQAGFYSVGGSVDQGATIYGSKLEESNLSTAVAMTDLIILQKAFDASAKSVTTSDQMIQNAINLKK